MEGNSKQIVAYSIVTVLCAISLFYYFLIAFDDNIVRWSTVLGGFDFIFCLGTMIYSGYMLFLSIKSKGEPILLENPIMEKNSLFTKDVFFKYLISLGVALFLLRITLFIDWIPINYYFSSRYGWVQNYVFVILPILLLFDAKYFDHLRCPTFKDMIILLCLLGIHAVYYIILAFIQFQSVKFL